MYRALPALAPPGSARPGCRTAASGNPTCGRCTGPRSPCPGFCRLVSSSCWMCCWPLTPAAISSLRAGQELRGHHHLVAPGKRAQRAAQVLLAGAALVADGGVKEVDAQLQPAPDDLAGVLLIQRPAVLAVAARRQSPCSPCRCGRRSVPKGPIACTASLFPSRQRVVGRVVHWLPATRCGSPRPAPPRRCGLNQLSFFAPCQCLTSGGDGDDRAGRRRLTAGLPRLLIPALAGRADQDLPAAARWRGGCASCCGSPAQRSHWPGTPRTCPVRSAG